MTERVIKEYDQLYAWALKHKCCGRRFKRKMYRMLRMNAWDVKYNNYKEEQKKDGEQE